MNKRILWLDNDLALIEPYSEILKQEGFDVVNTPTVSEAEELINTDLYDLVIIDVMIPTEIDEEEHYEPESTDYGHQTGLLFYNRMKHRLEGVGTQTLIMTIRWDKEIVDEFVRAGLPRERIVKRVDMRDADVFLSKIISLFK